MSEELRKLWKNYKNNPTIELRNELVLEYTWLVKRIVLRFRGRISNYIHLDDLVNQGIIALMDAVERFDIDMGNKFETYASIKIKGAAIDYMREQDWIPRSQRNQAKELDEVFTQLYNSYGRAPTRKEIANQMDISPMHLDRILLQRHDAIILSYEEAAYEKMMAVSPLVHNKRSAGAPESELLYGELKGKLMEAIDSLNERERLVVSLYYYENLKLKEIAEILEVTESRVSQIHSACILKLKRSISSYQED